MGEAKVKMREAKNEAAKAFMVKGETLERRKRNLRKTRKRFKKRKKKATAEREEDKKEVNPKRRKERNTRAAATMVVRGNIWGRKSTLQQTPCLPLRIIYTPEDPIQKEKKHLLPMALSMVSITLDTKNCTKSLWKAQETNTRCKSCDI